MPSPVSQPHGQDTSSFHGRQRVIFGLEELQTLTEGVKLILDMYSTPTEQTGNASDSDDSDTEIAKKHN